MLHICMTVTVTIADPLCSFFFFLAAAVPTPPHYVSGTTTVYQIGRVCAYLNPFRFLTLVEDYCHYYYGPTVVLTTERPVGQHWVKVFNADLKSKNQFYIVSFPTLEYVLKVTTKTPLGSPAGSSSVALAAQKIPLFTYVHGGAFKVLYGSDYLFEDTVSVTDGTVLGTWNHVKHVGTGRYLDFFRNHPPQCGKSYDPCVLSYPTATPIGIGNCTCTYDKVQWRYFD